VFHTEGERLFRQWSFARCFFRRSMSRCAAMEVSRLVARAAPVHCTPHRTTGGATWWWLMLFVQSYLLGSALFVFRTGF
jgi:hypothetical protein